MVNRILLQLPRLFRRVHYNNILLTLAVLTLFLLTGCQAKSKIAEAANDLIVFVARLSLLALAITTAGSGIMYILRAFDGEGSIPTGILLRIPMGILMGVLTLLLPLIFDTIATTIGYANIIPKSLR
ncbi:MAG: hypothetical protein QXS54_00860 [Candidatus Methanomethylicaceae archaeon]